MAASDRFVCENLGVNSAGHLTLAGQDTVSLAARYGTPLYLLDEDRIRRNCRVYTDAFRAHFPAGSRVLYAGKACCFKKLYRVIQEEGLGADVVSCGEIQTALAAGFDLRDAYFHSNNKTDADIRFAMERGVGTFVADGTDELSAIEQEAARLGIRQQVLLRLTPGIDPHTYAAVATGQVDSKFGVAIETGQAMEAIRFALRQSHIELMGFHCHVGSQVFAEDVFERSAAVMLTFLKSVEQELGFHARKLDLGGGYGVRYVPSDPYVDIGRKLRTLAETIDRTCAQLGLTPPAILLEPGRSIVADAGMTLYTVGAVKRIPGYKTYVSVDGGMTDNPRYALYGSRYTSFCAARMEEPAALECQLVGRCCESGDILQPDACLPDSVRRGDLVAVCTTGAYNYSMASNYNRIGRPPVVMLRGGASELAVRRETPEDLISLDL